jgi:tetratricopeptide (TPR) repeat protein
VKKQQIYLLSGGVVLLALLFLFGSTVAKKDTSLAPGAAEKTTQSFDIDKNLVEARQKLTIPQSNYIAKLENSISRGDVKNQQEQAFTQLANFWRDSLHNHELYVFYISKAASLVNSEKNLTFAARQILREVKSEQSPVLKGWKAEQAIALFEKAIVLNPLSDSLKVELASCYVFGKGMAGDPQETMKGIQQLLQVVKRDSTNMQAQLVLGIGGVVSTQYEKAVVRLENVVKNQPGNMEAITWLAEAYEAKGDKQNAIKWYEYSKRIADDPMYSKEVDQHIKQLKSL